jgi:hypothetical protein
MTSSIRTLRRIVAFQHILEQIAICNGHALLLDKIPINGNGYVCRGKWDLQVRPKRVSREGAKTPSFLNKSYIAAFLCGLSLPRRSGRSYWGGFAWYTSPRNTLGENLWSFWAQFHL